MQTCADTCDKGRFGPQCTLCSDCGTSAVCDEGITGTGRCIPRPLSPAAQACDCVNGICATGNAGCTCNPGWADATGGKKCSVCATGYYMSSDGDCVGEWLEHILVNRRVKAHALLPISSLRTWMYSLRCLIRDLFDVCTGTSSLFRQPSSLHSATFPGFEWHRIYILRRWDVSVRCPDLLSLLYLLPNLLWSGSEQLSQLFVWSRSAQWALRVSRQ